MRITRQICTKGLGKKTKKKLVRLKYTSNTMRCCDEGWWRLQGQVKNNRKGFECDDMYASRVEKRVGIGRDRYCTRTQLTYTLDEGILVFLFFSFFPFSLEQRKNDIACPSTYHPRSSRSRLSSYSNFFFLSMSVGWVAYIAQYCARFTPPRAFEFCTAKRGVQRNGEQPPNFPYPL